MIKVAPISKEFKDTDILLCNLLCFDKKGNLVCTIKECTLFSYFRGLYSENHYTKNVSKIIKYNSIKLVPVRKIGTAIIRK